MDLKNKKGIITVLVVVAVSLVAYKMLLKKDKRFFAKQIIDEGYFTSGIETLLSFDQPFLEAWAKAAKKGETIFMFGGRTYNTQGGKISK
jgi:hypothetical protein